MIRDLINYPCWNEFMSDLFIKLINLLLNYNFNITKITDECIHITTMGNIFALD